MTTGTDAKAGCVSFVIAFFLLAGFCIWAMRSCGKAFEDASARDKERAARIAQEVKLAGPTIKTMRDHLEPWLRREVEFEPSQPVRLHSLTFDGEEGLYKVLLELRFDPRRCAAPKRVVREWGQAVAGLLAVQARPRDLRVSVWTFAVGDGAIPWGHVRYRASQESFTFEPGRL